MGKYIVKIEDVARNDFKKHFHSGDKRIIKKIETVLFELSEHPYTGTGKPELLKYDLEGFWSRRLNLKHRIIYKVDEEIVTVFVIKAMGHYSDK
jgi:toxin YoeB